MNKDEQIAGALAFLRGKGWRVQYQTRTRMYTAESSARVHYLDWIDLVARAELEGWKVTA